MEVDLFDLSEAKHLTTQHMAKRATLAFGYAHAVAVPPGSRALELLRAALAAPGEGGVNPRKRGGVGFRIIECVASGPDVYTYILGNAVYDPEPYPPSLPLSLSIYISHRMQRSRSRRRRVPCARRGRSLPFPRRSREHTAGRRRKYPRGERP